MEIFKAWIPGNREILILVEELVNFSLFLVIQYILAAKGTLEALSTGSARRFLLFLSHIVTEEYLEILLDMLQKSFLLHLAEICRALNEVDMDVFEATTELTQRS